MPRADSSPADPERPRASWAARGLFVIALLVVLREGRDLFAPIVIAVVLTLALAPLVRALRQRGVPEVLGAALVVAALIGTVVPLGASLAGPAAQWWERAPQMITRVFAQIDRLRESVPGLARPAAAPPARTPRGTAAAPPAPPPDPVKERLTSEGVALTGALIGRGVSIAVSATATVILLYFLLASEHWMLARWVEAVPRRRARALVLGGLRCAQREIGRFALAVGIINVATGVSTGLALWWLGLPNPTLWAVLVAVLNFVPYIGPLMLVALLGVAGGATFDTPMDMLAPALSFLLIHAVETNLVSPWLIGRRLTLSPVSVFLSVMFWGWMWGIAGALIAVPLLIALRTACRRVPRWRALARFLDGDARPVPALRALLKRRRGVPAAATTAAAVAAAATGSEAVDVADVGRVDVLADVAGEPVAVARHLEDHA